MDKINCNNLSIKRIGFSNPKMFPTLIIHKSTLNIDNVNTGSYKITVKKQNFYINHRELPL